MLDIHIHCMTKLMYKLIKSCVSLIFSYSGLFGPRGDKTCLRSFANNTGADQPAHPHSLIGALVIRFMESIICELATCKIQFSN